MVFHYLMSLTTDWKPRRYSVLTLFLGIRLSTRRSRNHTLSEAVRIPPQATRFQVGHNLNRWCHGVRWKAEAQSLPTTRRLTHFDIKRSSNTWYLRSYSAKKEVQRWNSSWWSSASWIPTLEFLMRRSWSVGIPPDVQISHLRKFSCWVWMLIPKL